MGTGTDVALHASDRTLVRGDLRAAADAIRLSRRNLRVIEANLFWAVAYTETVLGRRAGVIAVEANPVAQTATVRYEPDRTSIAELSRWIRDCGYHCQAQSVPQHVGDPLLERAAAPPGNHNPRTKRGTRRRRRRAHMPTPRESPMSKNSSSPGR